MLLKKKIAAAAFCTFLGAGGLTQAILPAKTYSEEERRYLQKHPDFTWEYLMDGSFGEKYENYLSDQFPLRNALVGIKVMAERLQLKEDINEVYFGKDSQLMEKFDTEDLDTDKMEENLHKISEFASDMELELGYDHVKVMLVPSASEIMTKKLPFLAAPGSQTVLTENIPNSVPISDALSEHNQENLYYKTDHHWTALGAYYAYEAWAGSCGIIPYSREWFQEITVSDDFRGTVYSKVNLGSSVDTIQLFLPKEQSTYQIAYDDGRETSDSLYDMKALSGKDQYAVYLGGNHALVSIVNLNIQEDQKGKKILIIRDSYADCFAPFIVNHFEQTDLIDTRYFYGNIREYIHEGGYTDVLVLYQIPGLASNKRPV